MRGRSARIHPLMSRCVGRSPTHKGGFDVFASDRTSPAIVAVCRQPATAARCRGVWAISHRRIAAVCQWIWMLVACVGLLVATSFSARAEDTMEPSLRGEDRVISLPYGFWNETFGTAAAYVYAINGYPQPQAGLLGTIMAGTKGSALAFLMGQNIRPFSSERLFFDSDRIHRLLQRCRCLHQWRPALPQQSRG